MKTVQCREQYMMNSFKISFLSALHFVYQILTKDRIMVPYSLLHSGILFLVFMFYSCITPSFTLSGKKKLPYLRLMLLLISKILSSPMK